MQKMIKYLISFPNEHKQVGILSFQMGAKKSKTIIYCLLVNVSSTVEEGKMYAS